MAMLLGLTLEKLAEAYRKYGNVPIYVETADQQHNPPSLDGVVSVEIDIANIRRRGVAVVLETASLHKQLREEMEGSGGGSNPPSRRNAVVHEVPVGNNDQTQEISPVLPPGITSAKPREESARHRKQASSRGKTA